MENDYGVLGPTESIITEKEKQILEAIICNISSSYNGNFFLDPSLIRFRKCDYNWDKFYRMHLDTDTGVPDMTFLRKVIEIIRITYEDLPLYINDNNVKIDSIVNLRLKLGL